MQILALVALSVLSPPQAKEGQAFLDQMYARQRSVKSATLEVVLSGPGPSSTTKVSILRGGYLRMVAPGFQQIATPESTWLLEVAKKQYMKQGANNSMLLSAAPGFEPLLAADFKLVAKSGVVASALSSRKTKRVQVESAAGTLPSGVTEFLHVDPKTNLPAGAAYEVNGQNIQMEYRNVKLDAPLTPRTFSWSPPADWKEMSPAAPQNDLLKIGAKAPAFKVNTPAGKKMSLAEAMKGKKATLINFWFYG